eukprot:1373702-Amorphochlora_amoeboformis.AAC.1
MYTQSLFSQQPGCDAPALEITHKIPNSIWNFRVSLAHHQPVCQETRQLPCKGARRERETERDREGKGLGEREGERKGRGRQTTTRRCEKMRYGNWEWRLPQYYRCR